MPPLVLPREHFSPVVTKRILSYQDLRSLHGQRKFYPRRVEAPYKWVGNKSINFLFLRDLSPPLDQVRAYAELTFGAGHFFYYLYNLGALDNIPGFINDSNPFIMMLLQVIKTRPNDLSNAIASRRFEYTPEEYAAKRNELNRLIKKFNKSQASNLLFDGLELFPQDTHLEIALLTLYMLRNCKFGLWRVNKSGEFNTPFEKDRNGSANFILMSEQELAGLSQALARATITCRDYRQVLKQGLPRETLLFLDPPYETDGFKAYGGTGCHVQALRADCLRFSQEQNGFVMIANEWNEITTRELGQAPFNNALMLRPNQMGKGPERKMFVVDILVRNFRRTDGKDEELVRAATKLEQEFFGQTILEPSPPEPKPEVIPVAEIASGKKMGQFFWNFLFK